eukprot:2557975-Rhodomonas_salina.3
MPCTSPPGPAPHERPASAHPRRTSPRSLRNNTSTTARTPPTFSGGGLMCARTCGAFAGCLSSTHAPPPAGRESSFGSCAPPIPSAGGRTAST